MRGPFRALIVGAAIALASACSDPHGPPEKKPPVEPPPGTGTPGLTLTLHGAATDTITAPPDTLEAVLNDAEGRPVGGTSIVFSVPDPGAGTAIGMVGSLGDATTQLVWTVTTDATGHARARLWRTIRPGSGWVYATAASTASPPPSDSVRITTTAGQATALNIAPKDTVLNQGQSFIVTTSPTDRSGNATTANVTLEAAAGLGVNTMTVTALSTPGRHELVARAGPIFDVAIVDIIPAGTLAVRDLRSEGFAFATLGTDGSAYTPFVATAAPEYYGGFERDLSLQWAPSGDWLVFADQSGPGTTSLFRTTPTGAVTRIPFVSPTGMDLAPQISADGAWIYFEAMELGLLESLIYRVHPDGSGLERVSAPATSLATNDMFPSPSPDGRFIVYATARETLAQPRLQVLELATGTITSLNQDGHLPRWSPTGEWIAYARGGLIYVVHPDGTGVHRLSADFTGYVSPIGWSPDGKWIAAEQYGQQIDVIEVATGVTIPLRFTKDLAHPVWRPN